MKPVYIKMPNLSEKRKIWTEWGEPRTLRENSTKSAVEIGKKRTKKKPIRRNGKSTANQKKKNWLPRFLGASRNQNTEGKKKQKKEEKST